MTYQVLARKWRPKSFATLVGQEHVVRALTHALDGGRLHHAYLFTGTRGVGKTTLSRIFAKALNCETGVTSTPCGVCRACREIDEGRFVDYVEMDAASNRGVEEMAALLERAVYAPVDARFKVYMIDEVHMLTNHAFNSMLKTLEEPPAHVKFILATTDPQKIPVTVLSRCLQFNLKQMPAGSIVGHLEHVLGEEHIPFEPQALRLLARAADGSMRDALSLTDQAIAYSANQVTEEAVSGMLGALDQSYLIRLLDTLAEGDGQGVLNIADEMALRSLSFSTALQDLAGLLHKVAWAQFAPASVLDEWPEATDIRRFAETLSAEHVQLFYQIATIGRGEMGLAPDEYAGFTMTLLRMLAFEPAGGPGGGGAKTRAPVSGMKTAPKAAVTLGSPANSGSGSAAAASAQSVIPVKEVTALNVTTDLKPSAVENEATDMPATDSAPDVTSTAALPSVETAPEPVIAVAAIAPEEVAVVDASSRAEEVLTPASDSIENDRDVAKIVELESAPSELAAAAQQLIDESTPARRTPDASRPAGGASAALDVLRSAGNRVSSDRVARTAEPVRKPAMPKPAAPVVVPVPRRPPQAATVAVASPPPAPAKQTTGNAPWDDMPPDDYMPLSSEDDYFMSSPENFEPAFDTPPDAVRFNEPPSAQPTAGAPGKPDAHPLPAPVALDAIGVSGDWPSVAVDLPLKGIAYQLAFNSELTACDAASITLSVPVPQYADAAQVAKLKAALAEKLGREIEVNVSVGPARRTAAALDAATRAQLQQQAEQEISQDPFVQSLIRDFGASIVQGSIKPITAAPGAGAQAGS